MKGEIWKGQWKRGSGSCWESESCVAGKLSELIIIDELASCTDYSMEQSQQFLRTRKRLELP